MHGGMNSNGFSYTLSVVGVYWISSISSLRNTTWPGVITRFLPISNLLSSDIEMWPFWMSSSMFFMPSTRLSPLVSSARLTTSGLVSMKLLGDIASRYWRVAKASLSLASSSSWVLSTSSIIHLEVCR